MGNVIDISNYKCLTCKLCLTKCSKDTFKSCDKYVENRDKIDKKITVIMNTYRRSDIYLSEAIESFLKQSYKNAILQITNTHPSPLKLDKDYDNIVIYNLKDVFKQYPRHAVWSVFRVKTPYWTILDDDDIILPSYLEEFNKVIEKKEGQYIQIIRRKRMLVDKNKISKLPCGGWGGRLLSRFKVSDLKNILKKKPFNSYQGIDNYLTWHAHSGIVSEVKLPHTYITRRQKDVIHIYKRKDNNLKVVRNRISKSKKKAYSEVRGSTVSPHWEKDYIKEYGKYV
jgi:hypothetical protein